MNGPFTAIARRDGEGTKLSSRGIDFLIQIKASDEETDGAVFVAEEVVAPQCGPPLHIHKTKTEFFYFLQGTFEIKVGDQLKRCAPGDFVVVPPLVPHTFKNVGETPGHFLFTLTPGKGVHEFFRRFVSAVEKGPPTPEALAALSKDSDVEFVGPPL